MFRDNWKCSRPKARRGVECRPVLAYIKCARDQYNEAVLPAKAHRQYISDIRLMPRERENVESGSCYSESKLKSFLGPFKTKSMDLFKRSLGP